LPGCARKLAKEPGANLFMVPVQDIRIGGRQSNAQYQYTCWPTTWKTCAPGSRASGLP
jgi:ethanolamine utilization protein EutQ (cupin superfamily)